MDDNDRKEQNDKKQKLIESGMSDDQMRWLNEQKEREKELIDEIEKHQQKIQMNDKEIDELQR